jgi:hypothetical protein
VWAWLQKVGREGAKGRRVARESNVEEDEQ